MDVVIISSVDVHFSHSLFGYADGMFESVLDMATHKKNCITMLKCHTNVIIDWKWMSMYNMCVACYICIIFIVEFNHNKPPLHTCGAILCEWLRTTDPYNISINYNMHTYFGLRSSQSILHCVVWWCMYTHCTGRFSLRFGRIPLQSSKACWNNSARQTKI